MKRGRKPTGKALTGAERQARYRDRQNAALALMPDDPQFASVPNAADMFPGVLTLADLELHLKDDPRLLAEFQAETAEMLAELGEDEQ